MKPVETLIYSKIISEKIGLQELQQNANPNTPALARKIKHQRRLLAQLWHTAEALKRFTPLS